jgi:hypothetical protein
LASWTAGSSRGFATLSRLSRQFFRSAYLLRFETSARRDCLVKDHLWLGARSPKLKFPFKYLPAENVSWTTTKTLVDNTTNVKILVFLVLRLSLVVHWRSSQLFRVRLTSCLDSATTNHKSSSAQQLTYTTGFRLQARRTGFGCLEIAFLHRRDKHHLS